MSHEIRTPLNSIMGYSELLNLPGLSPDDCRDFEGRIQRNAVLLMRLIDDILDLTKIEAGKLEIEAIEADLPELLLDVAVVMRHQAEEKGLAFSMTIADALPDTIVCDPTRLKQILTNVIGNAIKFTAAGAVSTTVNVERGVKDTLRIVVRDTGEGMTPAQSQKIFHPFTQADASTTRKFGGTGLGLDLARQLAVALGGDIALVETAPGGGSTFAISVALVGAVFRIRPPKVVKLKDDGALRLNGVRVLLADDTADNRFLVTKYLTRAGASVDTASDGDEAVAMALAGAYDVILMDVQMPKLDGREATTLLRTRNYRGPIMALTAHAMRGEIDRCLLAGFDKFLTKPIGRQELVDLVDRMVRDQGRHHPVGRASPTAFQDERR